ncbi:biotin-dependent carboxyltransferase family protein [Aliiglaciecola sp. LCG003]|uniref:5-oxoprolinase subunit C family protein n=1 Tax=Aliiglaciecola sp. LCG003 TaxID=3053655 RepID=UPI0025731CCA|nr:biotin-dependent carboxyltransferase family protein [Aliiglaciecola sp. LCG003]WJG11049.1 biotin-dependent carboxyltransferase family protein [Aliiglaciecola sp. LCG003]
MKIISSGILALLVDGGRVGFASIGITQGGPVDFHACQWANWLCGNLGIKASIELLGSGASFEVNQACYIAVTGGANKVEINGHSFPAWRSFTLQGGDKLTISEATGGAISYLAIYTGFHIDTVFGSCTTVPRDALGGIDGKGSSLRVNDILPFTAHRGTCKFAPDDAHPITNKVASIRVVQGYQVKEFAHRWLQQFYSQEYTVSNQTSRMAARFTGKSILAPSKSMYSEGITRGAVQIPPDGIPIVMLNDRQTIGGYHKIGSVLSIDCDRLAQLSAGQKVIFKAISVEDAHNLLLLYAAKQQRLRVSIQ